MSSEFSRPTEIFPMVLALLGTPGAVAGYRQSHRRPRDEGLRIGCEQFASSARLATRTAGTCGLGTVGLRLDPLVPGPGELPQLALLGTPKPKRAPGLACLRRRQRAAAD